MLKPYHFLIALLLVIILPAAALADGFGFGWQYTGPASGFSLKLPLDRYLAVQPMLSLSLRNQGDGSIGHINYGLRGLLNLPALGPIHPYVGAGLGRSSSFANDDSQMTQGYQAFLGLEYQLSSLRPSFEVALGQVARSNGTMYLDRKSVV